MGLGLAICAQLVGLMDGRLWVESPAHDQDEEPSVGGPGSAFHFTVELGRAAEAEPPPAPPDALHGTRVLIADDNATSRGLLAETLAHWGMKPSAVDSGAAALEALQAAALERGAFDVILMDVQMPEMDGLEATAAIRQKEQGAGGHIPIIAMTAYAMQQDRDRCTSAGMDGYISKPIQPERVFDAIEQKDAAELQRTAHGLKGAVRHLGAKQASEAAYALEVAGQEARLADAPGLYSALQVEIERLNAAAQQLVIG